MSSDQEPLSKILENLSCKFDESQPGFETYLCPVCSRVFKDPVDHSCGNTFCSECVKNVSSCPSCGKSTTADDYRTASLFVKRTISSLKVVCGACQKNMTYDEFNTSHAKSCTFPCPYGCGKEVTRSTLEKHCTGGECKNQLVSCPAAEAPLSCKWRGHAGAEYDEHVSKCTLVPLIPMAKQMVAMQNSILVLQTTFEKLAKEKGISIEDILESEPSQNEHSCDKGCHKFKNGKCKICGQKYCCETDGGHRFRMGTSKCKYCDYDYELILQEEEAKNKDTRSSRILNGVHGWATKVECINPRGHSYSIGNKACSYCGYMHSDCYRDGHCFCCWDDEQVNYCCQCYTSK